jgi:hypothetical protein
MLCLKHAQELSTTLLAKGSVLAAAPAGHTDVFTAARYDRRDELPLQRAIANLCFRCRMVSATTGSNNSYARIARNCEYSACPRPTDELLSAHAHLLPITALKYGASRRDGDGDATPRVPVSFER